MVSEKGLNLLNFFEEVAEYTLENCPWDILSLECFSHCKICRRLQLLNNGFNWKHLFALKEIKLSMTSSENFSEKEPLLVWMENS